MIYWLQSLSENGFDVFTLVYIAVLIVINHYMLRWFINIKFEKLENKIFRSEFTKVNASSNTEDIEVIYEYLNKKDRWCLKKIIKNRETI